MRYAAWWAIWQAGCAPSDSLDVGAVPPPVKPALRILGSRANNGVGVPSPLRRYRHRQTAWSRAHNQEVKHSRRSFSSE